MTRAMVEAPVGREVNPASFTTVVNTAAETNLWDPAIWTEIPANQPEPGCGYHLTCGGIITTSGTSAMKVTPRWGQSATPASNVLLGDMPSITQGAATNRSWFANFTFTVRQVGTTGTGTGSGRWARGTQWQQMGGTVATIDTTVNQGLILSWKWSVAEAGSSATCQWVILRTLN